MYYMYYSVTSRRARDVKSNTHGACYDDRGITLRLKCFLNDGAPKPKIAGNEQFFYDSRCVPRLWDFSSGQQL